MKEAYAGGKGEALCVDTIIGARGRFLNSLFAPLLCFLLLQETRSNTHGFTPLRASA